MSGYAVPGAPGYLLALFAIGYVLQSAWPWLSWPFMNVPRWADLVIAAVLAVLAVIRQARWRRSAAWRDRQAFIAAADARLQGVWMDRENHQAFTAGRRGPRGFRFRMVTRIHEDSVLDHEDGDGEVPVLTETFGVFPLAGRVLRHDVTILTDPDTETARELPGPGWPRGWWREYRTAKTGFGFVAITPAQLAEVLAQLRASEQIAGEEELW